ncbi:MAG: hypothetical protein A2939_03550 [Parcubacteria group bacterium RIFCSPLOWO2_01_FULL_48_18]|nr:MAG: hypothetical protein A2939_03550 [Parcubacteria group bacterium RIFCSPLOWO2_01_FULL_48_18]
MNTKIRLQQIVKKLAGVGRSWRARIRERAQHFDLKNFFLHRKRIAGLVIFEDAAYVALYDEEQISGIAGKRLLFLDRYTLPIRVFEGGSFKNLSALEPVLKQIRQCLKNLRVDSLVISLPPAVSQFFVFEFPASVSVEEIRQAIAFNADSFLPLPAGAIYYDWEEIPNHAAAKREILLGLVKRGVIDPLLEAFKGASLAAIAVETHDFSLTRSVRMSDDGGAIAVFDSADDTCFVVYEKQNPIFKFSRSKKLLAAEGLAPKDLLLQFIAFVNARKKNPKFINTIFVVGGGAENERLKNELKMLGGFRVEAPQPIDGTLGEAGSEGLGDVGSIIAVGCALRGLIERKHDARISLMPLGTEELYERHRLISYLKFVQRLTVGFGSFFVIVFVAAFFILSAFEIRQEDAGQRSLTLPPDALLYQNAARQFNEDASAAERIMARSRRWWNVYGAIETLVPSGVVIQSVEVFEGNITIGGVARKRDDLFALRDRFRASTVFSSPDFPFTFFITADNIPFRLSFTIKDDAFFFVD